jgi:hypothetical protein
LALPLCNKFVFCVQTGSLFPMLSGELYNFLANRRMAHSLL